MPAPLTDTNLFEPLKVGDITLKHRLAMAPLTRYRNTDKWVPTDSQLEHYGERAENNGGLLIVEATNAAAEFGIQDNTPRLQTNAQVQGWKKIVDKIHENGSYVALQYWNLGRIADPAILKKNDVPFWSSSVQYFNEDSEKAAAAAEYPIREITESEIKWQTVEQAASAKQAIETAGFDFVELHVGQGFLPDQFFQKVMNQRTDKYGNGSIENRTRFIFELVDAVVDAVGAEKVAVKITPYAQFYGGKDDDTKLNPISDYEYLLDHFEEQAKKTGHRLAYISTVEPRLTGVDPNPTYFNEDTTWIDKHWKGVVMRAGALLHGEGFPELHRLLAASDRTIISAGRYFTSNPDLPSRLKKGQELTPYDRSTFYVPMSNKGYLGFGKFGEEYDHSKDDVVPKPLA